MNRPLSLTDPSGFAAFGVMRRAAFGAYQNLSESISTVALSAYDHVAGVLVEKTKWIVEYWKDQETGEEHVEVNLELHFEFLSPQSCVACHGSGSQRYIPTIVCHGRNGGGPVPGWSRTQSFIPGLGYFDSGSPGNILGNMFAGAAGAIASLPQNGANLAIWAGEWLRDPEDLPDFADHTKAGATVQWTQRFIYKDVDPNSLLTQSGAIGGDLFLAEFLWAKFLKLPPKSGQSFFQNTKYTDKVLKQMKGGAGEFHSFSESVRAFENVGSLKTLKGGDNIIREMLEIPGSYPSSSGVWKDGVFQFIKEADGAINHRLFLPTTP